jgi:hypothetical protein
LKAPNSHFKFRYHRQIRWGFLGLNKISVTNQPFWISSSSPLDEDSPLDEESCLMYISVMMKTGCS